MAAPVFTLLDNGYDPADNQVTKATASISPAANSRLVVMCWNADGTTGQVVTPTGLSLTWTAGDLDLDGGRWMGWYHALCGGSPGSGALTLTPATSTTIGIAWAIVQITGAHTSTPYPQSILTQFATNTTHTTTLPSGTPASVDSRSLQFWSHRTSGTYTEDSNYTQMGTTVNGSGPASTFSQGFSTSAFQQNAVATWPASGRSQGILIEVAAAASTGYTGLWVPGMHRNHLGSMQSQGRA
jgi:hypothetical protein